MDAKQHSQRLHNLIKLNDFNELLNLSHLDVNIPNSHGDTPLLTALKQRGASRFIERLLSAGANITIPNHKRITPLTYAVANCPDISILLLEKARDVSFLYEADLCITLHRTVKDLKCMFETCTICRGLEYEEIAIVIISTSECVTVRELNTFLDYLKAAEDTQKYDYYSICATLLKDAIYSDTAAVFQIIWKRIEHKYLPFTTPKFLLQFTTYCRYGNLDYIKCLHLILTSACASKFIRKYHGVFNTSFYQDLFYELSSRKVHKQIRIDTLLINIKTIDVSVNEVISAYSNFGFNEEVVMLLQYIKPEKLKSHTQFRMINFLVTLGKDEKLSVNNLADMNLSSKLSYRKLLNAVPAEIVDEYETIKLQKKVLNEVPTLFQLANHASQKCVQSFFGVNTNSQFEKVVQNLPLPP
ncbi:hypothetical protein ILUMI_19373, partial [Ignelater luminosus]